MLSSKAKKLLQALQSRSSGTIEEYFLRDDTGLSHGSIVAARRDLAAAGLLTLHKQGRRLAYELIPQKQTEMTEDVFIVQ